MRVARDTDPNLNKDPRTLATYDVGFISPAQVVDKNLTLSRPAMNVVLQYNAPAPGATVGVLWWNGSAWIKVGQAQIDTVLNTASFYTALPGTYQVRAFQAATELTLDKANVFPRIFTPNGDGINDEVLFVIENPRQSSIDGKIYDVAGNLVAELKPAGAGAPTPDTLSWNGRDRNGSVVRAGAYIYRVKGEGKNMTGTVVVAK
jgi:gliding motility-associated-like protein